MKAFNYSLYSIYNTDNFFKGDRWLYQIRINDYQLISILWNLFLMVIPFFLCWIIAMYWRKTNFRAFYHKIIALILGFLWLLFIPNSAYIISEVRHIINLCPLESAGGFCENDAWIILFFFAYAAVGWISFYYLVNQMGRLIKNIFNQTIANIYILLIIPLVSLGSLLGLVNRWNSWEVFFYPLILLDNIVLYVTNPVYIKNWLIVTIIFYILYGSGKIIFKDRLFSND